MFRKPREAANADSVTADALPLPSAGRPPTPPCAVDSKPFGLSVAAPTAVMATSVMPFTGRSPSLPKKNGGIVGKGKNKTNGNILSFFKKAEGNIAPARTASEHDDALFIDFDTEKTDAEGPFQTPTPPHDDLEEKADSLEEPESSAASPLVRYNENNTPVKKRKTSANALKCREEVPERATLKGPFLDDSDDERELSNMPVSVLSTNADQSIISAPALEKPDRRVMSGERSEENHGTAIKLPQLKRESTTLGCADEFDGIEDFIDEEFPDEGEEYMERRWMEEQAQMELEMEQDEDDPGGMSTDMQQKIPENNMGILPQNAMSCSCPICGGMITGMSEEQVSVHVNDCLDGKAPPLKHDWTQQSGPDELSIKIEGGVPAHKRFQRAAIARPGQENPFGLNKISDKASSAFSKLMSGHAEDNAWATAAAAEAASRGKPAYQRTCPFYKIMPGLFICVDAFRYGAVEGCNAYFLSHFHSDHYIGLTSSWCHGPIYCSHVTANLVRRQLRVDPKWVIDLEFDQKGEVPNTQGVEVTMIPANHCPGSSLFLFEKVVGKGKIPKVQRVLHCGDFRACPAQVQHPRLRPDVVDQVSGKLSHQKLDVCYLDTTYLTPKYAFPNQEEVIKACSDMCVSLSKDFVDDSDSWEQVKKERAGDGMVKFVRKASIKDETSDDVKIKIEDDIPTAQKGRGRLLVIVGTYSIGKERICLGIAKALNSKIYAPPNKQKIVAALEDPELSARMTNEPLEAQVHMQMLMEIRAETLADYLTGFKPHFSRIVGFRPSGWNYRPPNSRFTESPSVQTILHSDNWKSRYSMAELVPQRGSTREANCFGVPYSEHSSFRELTMFCCALRIDKIVPTVNVGSAKSRERMKSWCEKWAMEKKKNGLYKIADGQDVW